MARRLDFHSANFAADFEALLDSNRESDSDVNVAVASIIADIRNHGDQALLALTAKFDNLHAETVADLAVDQDAMAAALYSLDAELRAALELAADRIRNFHKKQLPQDFAYQDDENYLYLFSNKGNLFWKKKLSSQIIGEIQQVDL